MFFCSITFRLKKHNVYYHLIGVAGSGEKQKLLLNENLSRNSYTPNVETENEEDSLNPNAYHDLGPGMAVCILLF